MKNFLLEEFRLIKNGLGHIKKTRLSSLRKVFSLMGKWEKIIAVMCLAIILAGISYNTNRFYISITKQAPALGGQYNEGMIGQPRLINPLLATTNTDQALVRLVYSGLYKYNEKGELVSDLAESLPEISQDQKQYIVKIKSNAKWHGGKKLTSDDVLFTIYTLQDQKYGSPLRSLWLNTKVEKKDDNTIVFTNKDISGPFVHNLTLPILPAYLWQNTAPDNFLLSNNNLEAVGSGPYSIKEIKKLPSGQIASIKLESFSDFYSGKPNIDYISTVFYDSYENMINGLHSKEIDGFGFVSLDKNLNLDEDRNSIRVYNIPLPQYQAIFFNLKQPLFADKTIRLAMSMGTDRDQILKEVFNGLGKVPTGVLLSEDFTQEDNSLAKPLNENDAINLLEKEGWKLNKQTGKRAKGKTSFEFTITTNDFAQNSKTAELLKSQWEKLGATVRLNILSTKELTDTAIHGRKFDVLLFAQKLGADPDPFVFWHSSQIKDPGLNLTSFNNPEADKLITEARSTTNRQIRTEKYNSFQKIIESEVPAIFINQTVFVYAISSNIKNVSLKWLFDPSYRFFNSQSWYIQEKRILK